MKVFVPFGLMLAVAIGPGRAADDEPAKSRVVKATGIVEPTEVIDIGAQVTGAIQEIGVDYNSVVKRGEVLARIDPAPYKAEVELAKAALARTSTGLKLAKAKAILAAKELDRVKKRVENKSADALDLEVAKSALEVAQAAVPVEEADVAHKQAALQRAETNLDYTIVRSPVDGIVIDRRCTIGQRVTAGLNEPSLFLIAKDLKKVDVWASVSEADIAHVAKGQPATFTVDAFPKEMFKGVVSQIRLNATKDQEKITYTVVIAADNNDGKLLPYLTANVRIETGDK